MNELVRKQLAIDFCCKEEDVEDNLNHFTEHTFLAGRRRFKEKEEVFLKVAVVNGKVLFSGKPEILSWCKKEYEKKTGEWFSRQRICESLTISCMNTAIR